MSRERNLHWSLSSNAGARAKSRALQRATAWADIFLIGLCFAIPGAHAQRGAQPAADHFRQGVLLLAHQDWKRAAEEFRQALRANPQNAQAHDGLGVALLRMGNRADAEAAFRDALRLDANN